MHSGLQFGGVPVNSGKQEHEGESFTTWQIALGPQGDGWQRLIGTGGSSAVIRMNNILQTLTDYTSILSLYQETELTF